MTEPALEVRDLSIDIRLRSERSVRVVNEVSFVIPAGGTLGLVGESGSGKTLTSLAIMGLLPRAARISGGEILVGGRNLLAESSRRMRRFRGAEIAMVLQDPMTALDPCFTIGSQLSEPLRRHRALSGEVLREAMIASLKRVQLSASEERLAQYPHQLSGGMRQRVVSAIALAGEPPVLIADEPTTALDVVTQAQYLTLLRDVQKRTGFALLMIAHDLMLVREMCERVLVMYSGESVEEGPTEEVFSSPQHPYTGALLASVPVLGQKTRIDSIEGQAPDILQKIAGCRFTSRCRFSRDICSTQHPSVNSRGEGRSARCFGTEMEGWMVS